MTQSPLKLLLNAEPFGFGPTAAIAAIFPHVKGRFAQIGYAGAGHTLDLQKPLPYNALHVISQEPKNLPAIFADYAVLLTALDFDMATAAKAQGLKVAIYDPLTWYWRQMPPAIKECDLYLAQDFYGVRERIEEWGLTNAKLVSPLVEPLMQPQKKDNFALVNLGGLKHPYWSDEEAADYARIMMKAVRKAVPADRPCVFATSSSVARHLSDMDTQIYPYESYAYEDMKSLMNRAALAFMTSGLGNIFDSAQYNLPTLWLPPANDSQGQQFNIMRQHGLSDAAIDWPEIIEGGDIDYSAPQLAVLDKIKNLSGELLESIDQQDALVQKLTSAYHCLAQQKDSKSQALISRFGTGGANQLAQHLVDFANIPQPKSQPGHAHNAL